MKYDAEQFLTDFLKIPSVNGRDDERQAAWFLADFLRKQGVAADVQAIDSKHANVIAVLKGKTEETVIWNGHLDTVPYGKLEEWNTDPAQPVRKGERLYARGASDMKSGLAGMAYALALLRQRKEKPEQTICFCATCDEERGGLGAEMLIGELQKRGLRCPSLVLTGEPTNMRPGTAQKGCIWLSLRVFGRTSHGAYPEQGVNAVEYGIRIVSEIKEAVERHRHALLGASSLQITGISGGVAPNMTPDQAEIRLDIRVVPGVKAEAVTECVKKASEHLKESTGGILRTEISIENNRQALEIEEQNIWVQRLEDYLKERRQETKPIGISFFTDASILIKAFPEAPVLLFGPGEAELAHQPNESVEIGNYLRYIEILEQLF